MIDAVRGVSAGGKTYIMSRDSVAPYIPVSHIRHAVSRKGAHGGHVSPSWRIIARVHDVSAFRRDNRFLRERTVICDTCDTQNIKKVLQEETQQWSKSD